MSKKNSTFENEFEGATELQGETVETSTEAPTEAEGAVVQPDKEKETYVLNDGSTGSRAAFIREKFLTDNMSRKAIAEEYGFEYRVVYSATVNLVNEAESTTRGRSASNATIKVNSNNEVVEVKEVDGVNVTFVNGVAVDVVYAEEDLTAKSRNEWIKEVVESGVSRGDVATILGLSYGVIYSLTKEAEGTREAHMIELEDGTKISRAEYIRRKVAEGMSKGDIAKELGVQYSVVWQATKVAKSDADKYVEAVAAVKAFADKISVVIGTEAQEFADAIATLEAISVKDDSAEQAAADEAAENAATPAAE